MDEKTELMPAQDKDSVLGISKDFLKRNPSTGAKVIILDQMIALRKADPTNTLLNALLEKTDRWGYKKYEGLTTVDIQDLQGTRDALIAGGQTEATIDQQVEAYIQKRLSAPDNRDLTRQLREYFSTQTSSKGNIGAMLQEVEHSYLIADWVRSGVLPEGVRMLSLEELSHLSEWMSLCRFKGNNSLEKYVTELEQLTKSKRQSDIKPQISKPGFHTKYPSVEAPPFWARAEAPSQPPPEQPKTPEGLIAAMRTQTESGDIEALTDTLFRLVEVAGDACLTDEHLSDSVANALRTISENIDLKQVEYYMSLGHKDIKSPDGNRYAALNNFFELKLYKVWGEAFGSSKDKATEMIRRTAQLLKAIKPEIAQFNGYITDPRNGQLSIIQNCATAVCATEGRAEAFSSPFVQAFFRELDIPDPQQYIKDCDAIRATPGRWH